MSLKNFDVVPVPVDNTSPLSVLVTGASRGIGLELVRQYAAANRGNKVFATARSPSSATGIKDLQAKYSNIHLVDMGRDEREVGEGLRGCCRQADRSSGSPVQQRWAERWPSNGC